ncbi:MAG: hypothetical protein K6A43_04910 [Treponema sp.]|nr:hypothetical protein [Treponema sp.]
MEEKKIKDKSKLNSAFWLFRLTRTSVFILFFFCVLLFLFYLMGNYQNFMDKTQLLILTVLGFSSVLEVVLSFLGLVEIIFFMITNKFRVNNIFSLLFLILAFIISIIFVIYAVIIKRFATGV